MLALSVNSDTEWEMQVLRWKTMEQASGGSRPSDKRGPDDQDPEIRWGAVGWSQKKLFWSKNKGEPGSPGPLPWIRNCRLWKNRYVSIVKGLPSCSFFPPVWRLWYSNQCPS